MKKQNKNYRIALGNNFLNSKPSNKFQIEKNYEDLQTILKKEKIELFKIFDNLLIAENEIENNSELRFAYEIESDNQYLQNEIFYAEGNVSIFLPYGVFKSEKISYDKKNKILKAFKNINFEKGGQYLTASYLEYDFKSEKGKINNVYGIIDFNNIEKDFNYAESSTSKKNCPNKKIKLTDLPNEVQLLSSSNLRFRNSLGLDAFTFDFASITKWRFKTEVLLLENNKWKSDLILFTNDPYNKPQFIVRSRNFVAEVVDGKTNFKSGSTSLNFDNKFNLPIGRRTITDGDTSSRWGLGYESNEKDGLYLIRSFDSINFGNDFELNLQPYFLIQRVITGKSNSFREKGAPLSSKDISTNIQALDYLSMKADLDGSIFNFNLNSEANIKTFNPERFYDAFSANLNLTRNIYSRSTLNKNKINSACEVNPSNNRSKNHDIDFGLYTQFDKDDLYLGYGAKLLNKYTLNENRTNKDYSLIIDYGQFKGKGLNNDDNSKLLSLSRSGLNISLSNNYKIADFSNNTIFDKDNKYTSKLNEEGIYLNSKISYGTYFYSNGKNQNIFSFSLGPSLIFGKLKRDFLDYTNLSIYPEFIIKGGQSPFKFDDFNNDSRIKLSLKQQLYGPLIFGLEGNYNINNNSSSYGDIENITYLLGISRRAYSINLSYNEDNKAVFLGFKIFNFDYQKSKKSF